MRQRLFATSRGYSSNSNIFERRGDPWMTEREGRSDFGRDSYEDPDIDAHFRAGKAPIKQPDHVAKAKPRELTAREEILRRHQSKMLDIGNRLHKGVRNGGF